MMKDTYECDLCWQSFNSKRAYTVHNRVHMQEDWDESYSRQKERAADARAHEAAKHDLIRLRDELA